MDTPTNSVWTTIRNLDGRKQNDIGKAALKVIGRILFSDETKAKAFAASYANTSHLPQDKRDSTTKGINHKFLKDECHHCQGLKCGACGPFTIQDL